MNIAMKVKKGSVSGVPFAIDDIVKVCGNIPEIVKIERTSENSAVYYFTGDYDRVSMAEEINRNLLFSYPAKYDA